jgi:phthiocerol/phenolphthiocerol synthesis type-I polyketide synthase B
MRPEPIAIIGMSCRLPGAIGDLSEFWNMLAAGRDVVGTIPNDRMDIERYLGSAAGAAGKFNTRYGGYLEAIEQFDAAFFGIAPRDAERMDPQHRILLELAWEALEDAGQDIGSLEGSDAGVYVGAWTSDFENRLYGDPAAMDLSAMLGAGRFALSGRLSYCFDLRGPSMTVDTACSSSLVGVHLAVRALRERQCGLALVGAVNLILGPQMAIAYNSARVLAADGRCKFGDAAADGFVRSEAAALIVLKPLKAALADGDRIHGVINGSAIGNDGRASGSLGRPSRSGQAAILRAAYDDAAMSPASVGYVEAHGTGTRAGDPVELGALADVMGVGRPPDQPLHVGSIKTNIGHTEAAAGLVGLIKATLIVRDGEIPRSLHLDKPHPGIPWSSMPLEIVSEAATLSPSPLTQLRTAGVSSYGIAGANAHVVVSQPPARGRPLGSHSPLNATSSLSAPPSLNARTPPLLPLSARSPAALRALAAGYADRLSVPHSDERLGIDTCWGAATRRTALNHRAVFAARDIAELRADLRRFAAGDETAAAARGIVRGDLPPPLAFVMPGHGGQFVGMGRELLAGNAAFRASIEECSRAVQEFAGWSLVTELVCDAPRLDRMEVRQPLLCALSIAYAAALRDAGVQPTAVIGHSMGEVAAAAVAGVLSIDQCMRIICRRGALMQPAVGRGAMALVELPVAEVQGRVAGHGGRVVVAAVNGPRNTVISGDPDPVREIIAAVTREGIFCQSIKLDLAAHSAQMTVPAAALKEALAGLEPVAGTLPVYSTVTGASREGAAFDAAYWADNLRMPVLFDSAVRAMVSDGVRCFVELGAHPVLVGSLQDIVPDGVTLACGRRGQPAQLDWLTALGALWSAGCALDWRRVLPAGEWTDLPLYPWQRERHWADAALLSTGNRATRAPRLSETHRGWLYRLDWKRRDIAAAASTLATAARWCVLGAGPRATALATLLDGPLTLLDALTTVAADVTDLAVLIPDDDQAAFMPVRVLKTLLAGRREMRLWFITEGGQAVSETERVSIPLAASWGTARSIGEEYPALWGGLADIGSGDAAVLAQHLRQRDGEDQVALRAGQRFVLRLVPSTTTATPYVWREDGAYVITGGLGSVGLALAARAASAGARRLVLLGRTALPSRDQWGDCPTTSPHAARIAAIRALEARGVAVQVASVDVADEHALRAFLEGYEKQGWPPIRGVVHAAGASAPMLLSGMDEAAFDRVLAPKLHAARLLDRLFPDVEIFALVSSFTSFLPHAGIAPYVAANVGLDALAQDRHARGIAAVSIGWGFWEATGLAASDGGRVQAAAMARMGLHPLPPVAASEIFSALCADRRPYHAVLQADWAAFRQSRAGQASSLFADVMPASAASGPVFAARLDAVTPAARRALLVTLVRESLGIVLKLAPDRFDDQTVLGDLGLSSLRAIELRNRLETALGMPLPATLAWNYPTVAALADYLERIIKAVPDGRGAEAPVAGLTAANDTAIDAMSEDDALRLLMSPSP